MVATVNTQPETCAPTGTTREVQNTILAAVKNLRTNLTIESNVKLDDYQTPLNFNQYDVATVLDPNSVLYLTTILGPTIVSSIVQGVQLSFSSGSVYQITDDGFKVDLVGVLANAGPFDALIEVRLPLVRRPKPRLTHRGALCSSRRASGSTTRATTSPTSRSQPSAARAAVACRTWQQPRR